MRINDIKSQITSGNVEIEDLLKCVLAINSSEIEAYSTLLKENKFVTVHRMAKLLKKSRPTAQRLLQNLISKGLALRKEILIDRGGRHYGYKAIPREQVKERIREALSQWYTSALKGLDESLEEIS
ncbi:MAG: helix-turn-helix domain-containing protein [Candidatus Hodarchaeota archaeon]